MEENTNKSGGMHPQIKSIKDSVQKLSGSALPAIHKFMAKAGPHARSINEKIASGSLKAVRHGNSLADRGLEHLDGKIKGSVRSKVYPLAVVAITWVVGFQMFELIFEGRPLSETVRTLAPLFLFAFLKIADKAIAKFGK